MYIRWAARRTPRAIAAAARRGDVPIRLHEGDASVHEEDVCQKEKLCSETGKNAPLAILFLNTLQETGSKPTGRRRGGAVLGVM